MDDSTQRPPRVTSAQRAVTVLWLQRGTRDLALTYLIAWADACAALVDAEHGAGARALLHHLTDDTPRRRPSPHWPVGCSRHRTRLHSAASCEQLRTRRQSGRQRCHGGLSTARGWARTGLLRPCSVPRRWTWVATPARGLPSRWRRSRSVMIRRPCWSRCRARGLQPMSSRGRPGGWQRSCSVPPTWSTRPAPAVADDGGGRQGVPVCARSADLDPRQEAPGHATSAWQVVRPVRLGD